MAKTPETATKKKVIRITVESTPHTEEPPKANAEAQNAQVTAEGAARRRRRSSAL